jgi:FkbM family methyltransferase
MSWIKTRVQQAASALGYEVRRKREPGKALPVNVLPLVVQDLLRRKAEGRAPGGADFFFVQVGAHDGLHYDPIRPFVTRYHWRGILVEPQPAIFERLVTHYSGEPQLIFENVAISERDGEQTLYRFRPSPALPDHATMLASFRRSALVNNAHGYAGEIEEVRVPTLTVPSLLARHGVEQVDLLQIDTEGFDYPIVRMLGPTSVRPSIIHFESAFMSPDEHAECAELLDSWGYRLLTIGVDTLAYRQEDDSDFTDTFRNEGYG